MLKGQGVYVKHFFILWQTAFYDEFTGIPVMIH